MRLRFRGLHFQLLGLLILPFGVLVTLLSFASVRFHGQAMRQLVAERDERAVQAASAGISERFLRMEAVLRGVSLKLEEGVTPEHALGGFGEGTSDSPGSLALLDKEGRLVAGALPTGVSSEAAIIVKAPLGAYKISLVSSDGISFVLWALRSGSAFITAALSVPDLIHMSLPGLARMGGEESAFIVDEHSQLLAEVGATPSTEDLPSHVGVAEALRGSVGSTFLQTPTGEHVVAYGPVRPLSWALVIEEPWERVASPLLRISLAAPLAMAPTLGIALLALWFGARRIVIPLRALQAQAERMAAGDFDAPQKPVGGVAEISELEGSVTSMYRRVRSAQQALRGYAAKVTHAQEEERRHLARELHDETIQDLIALDQRIQILACNMGERDRREAPLLEELRRAVRKAIEDLRRLSRSLRPIYLEELGLVPALEALAHDAERNLGIPVSFSVEATPFRFPPGDELAVYRIVQEALSNVGRHARAAHAWVDVGGVNGDVSVSVRDDGIGFVLPEQYSDLGVEGHYGLIGMWERALLIGGQLEVKAAPGLGTRVTLRIPLGRPA